VMLTRRRGISGSVRQQCFVQEFIRGEVVGRVWRGTHAHGVDSLWVQPVDQSRSVIGIKSVRLEYRLAKVRPITDREQGSLLVHDQ
jgi:hypothetical protein